jgi:hypothetical protein
MSGQQLTSACRSRSLQFMEQSDSVTSERDAQSPVRSCTFTVRVTFVGHGDASSSATTTLTTWIAGFCGLHRWGNSSRGRNPQEK